MSNVWFTSDTHFHHKNILNWSGKTRPCKDVQEMNEMLIYNWNSQVKPCDRVYVTGDFSFGNKEQTEDIIRRLNGFVHLIYGNHDTGIRESQLKTYFTSASDYKEIKVDGQRICMMHFPIIAWHQQHRGSWMLHGHTHGGLNPFDGKILDIGIDNRPEGDMMLWSFEEIKTYMNKREIVIYDQHGKG